MKKIKYNGKTAYLHATFEESGIALISYSKTKQKLFKINLEEIIYE